MYKDLNQFTNVQLETMGDLLVQVLQKPSVRWTFKPGATSDTFFCEAEFTVPEPALGDKKEATKFSVSYLTESPFKKLVPFHTPQGSNIKGDLFITIGKSEYKSFLPDTLKKAKSFLILKKFLESKITILTKQTLDQ